MIRLLGGGGMKGLKLKYSSSTCCFGIQQPGNVFACGQIVVFVVVVFLTF